METLDFIGNIALIAVGILILVGLILVFSIASVHFQLF